MSDKPTRKKPAPVAGPSSARDRLWENVFPEPFRTVEDEALETRKRKAGLPGKARGRLGLALSGGGIRSATFCLGVLQEMARTPVGIRGAKKVPLLRRVDYLSTVSGGGYIGSFFGALFVRANKLAQLRAKTDVGGAPPAVVPADLVEARLGDNASEQVKWLRENGRYLAPNGSGDLMTAGAVHLRNWLSVVILVGLTILPLFLLLSPLAHLVGKANPVSDVVISLFARPDSGFWWWSPAWSFAVLAGIAAAACGGAYWISSMVSAPKSRGQEVACFARIAAFIVPWPVLVVFESTFGGSIARGGLVLTCIAVFALLFYGVARWRAETGWKAPTQEAIRRMGNMLSRWLKMCLIVLSVTVVYGVIDSLGQSLYVRILESGLVATIFFIVTGLAASFPAVRSIWTTIMDAMDGDRPKMPIEIAATVVAIILFLLFLLNLNLLAQGIAWRWSLPVEGATILDSRVWDVLMFLGISLLLAWAGSHLPFVNSTSAHPLYGARLARAYLGAANAARHETGAFNVTEPMEGDDLELADYKPHEHGGPIHLMNVTFNETISGKSHLENRDRQGMAFAVGPAGMSVGRRHHAIWVDSAGDEIEPIPDGPRESFMMFPEKSTIDRLSVGQWAAISGAAVGTGMGGRTSLGMSLLAGLANIRLGYWWDSGIEPEKHFDEEESKESRSRRKGNVDQWLAKIVPAQSYLFDEWFAKFHGPFRRHWHLSDGGHFENTAVYELLRRRVPHILCCDCGADPQFNFADIANLVRKARIDFGAEVRFLSRADLEIVCAQQQVELPKGVWKNIGVPEPLQSAGNGEASRQVHAHLGVVRFQTATPGKFAHSLILFLKPALSGDESVDLQEYQAQHPRFPQECTSDQFFNEAQWESYRKLGEHTARSIFECNSSGLFWFSELDPEKIDVF